MILELVVGLAIGSALAGWVAWDADRRGRSWFAWSRLLAWTGFIGLIAWFVVRRRTPVTKPPGPRRSLLLALSGIPVTLATAAIASAILTYGFQLARIEGQAMSPTLESGSRVIVNKLAYVIGEPEAGDIIMLWYPEDPAKAFVKRIVAVSGDVIRSEDGRVTVNEKPEPVYAIPEEFKSRDTWGPYVVKKGFYFVMGDHRNNSSDSRAWGEVPRKYVIGRIAKGSR